MIMVLSKQILLEVLVQIIAWMSLLVLPLAMW